MKEISIDDLVKLFFDEFKAPCKKGEQFKMDGQQYVCTDSSKDTFEYKPIGGGDGVRFFSF